MNSTAETCLTVIVLTFNEEHHLPGCLESIRPLCDEVVVFDSGSVDRTRVIAEGHGARVIVRSFDGYAAQRTAALQAVDTPWVLFLDADERLTRDGIVELRSFLRDVDRSVVAAQLPRRNIFFGRELRGGGWWPDEQTRLLRRGSVRYAECRQVHEVVVADGEVVSMIEPLVHLNYDTWREFFVKQRTYTHLNAGQAIVRGSIPRRRAYLSMPVRVFFRRFVTLRGYRDGFTGLGLAAWMALEEVRLCWLVRRGSSR